MQRPKLRDSKNRQGQQLYPIGEFPKEVIHRISKWIVYHFAVGKSDIGGEDWGDIFAKSIDGEHLSSPLGLADVVIEGQAWSVKSVKYSNPHGCNRIRVISGRNSPDYSYGIKNPHDDIQKTGDAVLGIWNERVNIALDKFDFLRTVILIRDVNKLDFTLFELETHRFPTNEYVWRVNARDNFEGNDRTNERHCFTWQPHGSQFTIIYPVPASAVRFSVKRPPVLDFEKTIEQMGFDESWVTIF